MMARKAGPPSTPLWAVSFMRLLAGTDAPRSAHPATEQPEDAGTRVPMVEHRKQIDKEVDDRLLQRIVSPPDRVALHRKSHQGREAGHVQRFQHARSIAKSRAPARETL